MLFFLRKRLRMSEIFCTFAPDFILLLYLKISHF